MTDAQNLLSSQEERLVACAASGKWWQPEGDAPDLEASKTRQSANAKTIRASVIRSLAIAEAWPGHLKPWPVSPKGLKINGATISGSLDLEGAVIDRVLWLHNCTFESPVNLMDAECRTLSLHGSKLAAGLEADRAFIKGDLYFRGGFSAIGKVSLRRTKIEGQLDCTDGHFENTTGTAIEAEAAVVGGGVFLRYRFTAKGQVTFRGAKIAGQFSCVGGRFENEGKCALDADTITVGQDILLSDGFSAKGEVNLVGAEIGDHLGCDNGHFENLKGMALDANAAIVGGSVLFRNGFSAKGEVNLVVAKISGDMRCIKASFANAGGDAIDLTLAKIDGGLFFRELRPAEGAKRGIEGGLLLSQARCRAYCDDRSSWPETGTLLVDGFTYERFHDCDTDWKSRRDWLRLQTGKHLHETFRPQPWTQAINVLRDMGHDSDAKDLAICREIARAKSKGTRLHIRVWTFLLRLAVGNGYKPWRAFWWSCLFVVLGWLTFASAGSLGYMAPRDGNVRVTEDWNTQYKLPYTYPPYNGLVYALDAYLPVIEFGQDEAWEPSTKKTIATLHAAPDLTLTHWVTLPDWFFVQGWHRVLYWVEELLGWIFVSLFIAGMSGLMKKE